VRPDPQGLSNVEIGQCLHLSEGTVKTHVGRVFAKLDLRDRVQAVIFGYEANLVAGTTEPDLRISPSTAGCPGHPARGVGLTEDRAGCVMPGVDRLWEGERRWSCPGQC